MQTNSLVEQDALVLADCVEYMRNLPDDSVDCVITSPPYDNLHGMDKHFDFNATAKELYRIIKPHHYVVWVVNDSRVENCRSGNSARQLVKFLDKYKFDLHEELVIVRSHTKMMGHSCHFNCFEKAYCLTKGRPRTPNILQDKPNRTGGARRKETSKPLGFRNHCEIAELGYRSNVWYYKVGGPHTSKDKFTDLHPARMTEEMAEDLILTFSKADELVFDCFSGVGTTAKMAWKNGRHYLGCEIDATWHDIAIGRLKKCF